MMTNNIIYSENIRGFKCLFWQGQPVYKQYPKLKNFIRQHLGEEVAAIFAEPHIPDDYEKSNVKASWSSDLVDDTAIPFSKLPEAEKKGIEKDIEVKVSVLLDFYQSLLESENPEDNKWGQLLSKATEVPDKGYIMVQGTQFVFVLWGFEQPSRNMLNYSIKKDFYRPGHKEQFKNRDLDAGVVPLEDTPETPPPVESPKQERVNTEPKTIPASAGYTQETIVAPPVDVSKIGSVTQEENKLKIDLTKKGDEGNVTPPLPPVNDKPGWFKRFWWLLLILLLILAVLLFKTCGSGGGGGSQLLPEQPGKIIPIDSTKITKDPDSITTIISDRLNIALTGPNKDIEAFARKFKDLYPGNAYQVIYYDTIIHKLQVQIPEDKREIIKAELEDKMPEFKKMLIWNESLMQRNGQPSDPAYKEIEKFWYQNDVKALGAWDITEGDSSLVIAIIDDGFDLTHPEFQGKIVKPWNIPEGNNQVNTGKKSIHGTHVAGIALALADNNTGASGIAHKCKFMPVQVADRNGLMSSTAIIDGVLYAINNGADVINMSLGMQVSPEIEKMPPEMQMELINTKFKDEEEFWDELFDVAYKKNVIIVLAAGNQNVMIGLDPMERSHKTIKVSAVDPGNKRAVFSNYGPGSTISAPGVHIYSSLPNRSYNYLDGTSMASPIVAGGVALIKSVNPSLSFDQVVDLIQSTGIPVNSPDRQVGNILQLDRALNIAKQNRQKMPVVDCPDVQNRIDSLLQEIEKLRRDCSKGNITKDTMKIPPGTKDLNFAVGRWKSTSYIYSLTDGNKVTLYFDFYNTGTGKITLVESDNTKCSANLSLSMKADEFNVVQNGSADCQPPPKKYQPYIFKCKPGANGCAECEAQNRNKANNNFKFNLIKIN